MYIYFIKKNGIVMPVQNFAFFPACTFGTMSHYIWTRDLTIFQAAFSYDLCTGQH